MTDIKSVLRELILSDQILMHLETLKGMTKESVTHLSSAEQKLERVRQFLLTVREAVKRRSGDDQVEILNRLPFDEFIAVLRSREFTSFLTELLGTLVAYLKEHDSPRAGLGGQETEYTTLAQDVTLPNGVPPEGAADETEEGVDGQGAA